MSALSQAALAAFSNQAAHRSKQRRPPSPAARAEAGRIRARTSGLEQDQPVVVDLARYAAAAAGRNTLTTQTNTEKGTNQQ